jgi:rhamnulokinase
LASVINPNDPRLVAPDNMPETIAQLCRQSGQPAPESHGATIRCALESLALCYREVLEMLENLIGNTIETIHIVGGGSQNELLNQMTADACGRTVAAGPVEATAIGNLLVQVQTANEVTDHAQARDVVRASFPVKTFEPQVGLADRWDEAADRFARFNN